jgi:hypothetical protein
MATANNSRITLELQTGADPIRGSIQRSDGNWQPFWGWLELIEQLRRVAAGAPAMTPPPSPRNLAPPPETDAQAVRPRPNATTSQEP